MSQASPLLTAIARELRDNPSDAGELATLLRELAPPEGATLPSDDGWLDTRRASVYLGLSPHALHKLTATRAIPFEQDGPGCRCWFKRSSLDDWRRGAR